MFKLIGKEINATLGAQMILIWTYVDLDLFDVFKAKSAGQRQLQCTSIHCFLSPFGNWLIWICAVFKARTKSNYHSTCTYLLHFLLSDAHRSGTALFSTFQCSEERQSLHFTYNSFYF